jgi:serine/threonine protein kinase
MVESNAKLPAHKPPSGAKPIKDLNVTNEEFFKQNQCMYFTDEVWTRVQQDVKFVNEFAVLENIGAGSYSKVKRVVRQDTNQEGTQIDVEGECAEFAMKMMHKPTLKRERAIRYDLKGEMQMINNLDKVYTEIDVWTQLNHPYIAKLYEMIDSDAHDYLYLILELADMGQIANWNFKIERYEHNQQVFNFVIEHLKMHNGLKESVSEVEQVAQYLFR